MRKLAVLLILVLPILAGCTKIYETKKDYFGGATLAEYHQVSRVGQNDTLTMTFYEKGTYKVSFSYTKGYERNSYNQGRATLPQNFTITVADNPLVKVISQYVLPGFLTVTITHGETTESHDFK